MRRDPSHSATKAVPPSHMGRVVGLLLLLSLGATGRERKWEPAVAHQ